MLLEVKEIYWQPESVGYTYLGFSNSIIIIYSAGGYYFARGFPSVLSMIP